MQQSSDAAMALPASDDRVLDAAIAKMGGYHGYGDDVKMEDCEVKVEGGDEEEHVPGTYLEGVGWMKVSPDDDQGSDHDI